MKKYPVYNITAEKVKEVELNPKIFGVQVKEAVVHQAAVAQMANARRVLAHTKDRGEVRGGGAKPWRQKGTGRARHGSVRSPLWVGGGITFGPTKERNFSKKVNKKMKRKALFMCLSDKVNNNLLILLDKLNLEKGKTKEMVEIIGNLKEILHLKEIKKLRNKEIEEEIRNKKLEIGDINNGKKGEEDAENQKSKIKNLKSNKFDIKDYKLSLLLVLPKSDKKIFNAGRNLEGIKITTADSLNVVDLLKYEKVLMVEDGLGVIEKTYLKQPVAGSK